MAQPASVAAPTRPVVIVSNRGPLSFHDQDGELRAKRGGGGLVSGVLPLVTGTDTLWIAAALSDADRRAASDHAIEEQGINVRLLALPPDDFRAAYDVIGNATLWFVHHGLFDTAHRPRIDDAWWSAWEAYCRVNAAFADAIAESAPEQAIVLLQDYHLTLAATRLRGLRADLTPVHFSHTPFAGPDLFHVLPHEVRTELLQGMAAHVACGFHTSRWARGFEQACVEDGIEPPPTFVGPLGPDPDDLLATVASPACTEATSRLEALIGNRRVILRVDRLELSKNLERGFLAYDRLLAAHPEHRTTTTFAAFVYPSREGLPEYLAYRQEVEGTVRRINARWGTPEWTPILLDISDDHPTSIAALRMYDVLLVNPVRDGLNLVAREGPVVNERSGVLALSTEAGAFAELAPEALAVDPFDIAGTAEVLQRALTLPAAERAGRAARLRALATARSPAQWLADQLAAVS